MMMWTPRTLADDLIAETIPVANMKGMGLQTMTLGDHPDPPPPAAPVERVPCPCGRLGWPFEMVAVGGLPAELTGGAAYLCCGCTTALIRDRHITRAEYLEALGAPPEVVQRAQEMEDPYVP